MVESASLLRRYTGNCIEGSNPSLSAILEKNMNDNEMIKDCIQLYFDGCYESDPDLIHNIHQNITEYSPLSFHYHSYFSPKWRRVRDSNPRYSYPYTSLAGRRFRPLSQLSEFLLYRQFYDA